MSLLDLFENNTSDKKPTLLITSNAQSIIDFDVSGLELELISSLKDLKEKNNRHKVVITTARDLESLSLDNIKSSFLICLCKNEEDMSDSLNAYMISNTLSSLMQALDVFASISLEKDILDKVDKARVKGKDLYKNVIKRFNENDFINDKSHLYKVFWQARLIQLTSKGLDDFLEQLISTFLELECLDEITFVSSKDLVDLKSNVLSIEWIRDDLFLSYTANHYETVEAGEADLALYFLTEVIDRYFLTIGQSDVSTNKKTIWEESFNRLESPVAIIANTGDLVLYNSAFTHLEISPSFCLKIDTSEVFNLGDDYYNVFVKAFSSDAQDSQSLFFFQKVTSSSEHIHNDKSSELPAMSSSELGIISSSIAHELNNPLAGILAAISLLELEEWDEEGNSSINDMKKSATRCKDLVEIFLSFSNSRDREKKAESPRSALTQAMDLLRFRMIESGVRIKVSIANSNEEFSKKVNLSLSTMIFYMLLGDIVTSFNRTQMVTGAKEELIEITYKEKRDHLLLTTNCDLSQNSDVIESKLMSYLLGVLGLSIEIEDNKLRLTSQSMI